MKTSFRQWANSRVGQYSMIGLVAYALWRWYEELASAENAAWIANHAGQKGYAAVFAMGILVGCLVGVAFGPVILRLLGIRA